MVFNCSLHRSTLEMERSILVMTGTTSKCYYVEKRREIKKKYILFCNAIIGKGLGLNALRGVHKKQYALAGR